ncbi:hypothetical protein LFADAHJC_LOCUS399 [Methylorubrum extorquens]
MLRPHRMPCHRLTFEEAVQVHIRLMAGEMYSRTAADYDVNQGRIADVKFVRLHPTSREEAVRRSGR